MKKMSWIRWFYRLLTDFICLYIYEFWLSLCKIVRGSVILLLPLFVSEFFKSFWNNLGKFVFRSINYGYKTGQLSITQKLGIITCIPKEDKPRQFMKKWRPISLLNTVYKLASRCIAERIKSVLPIRISNDQTGFIPDRYIGELTLLIYDILHFTEEQDIPGILLLIYIEEAFNTISWMFIESVLDFFNFGFSIKQWAKSFHTNITSAVTQNCCLSRLLHYSKRL